ncbi:uncharacterized protein LOC119833483 [Zerene cesonia]|uniref:uncharacterized protein LOC119833483 n=1 Tax=Zerene cesonia TaxID=33412 RepID=UPI0018E5770F|nr:uncharacterized protein LOC119833483 [Zerene cesonia]
MSYKMLFMMFVVLNVIFVASEDLYDTNTKESYITILTEEYLNMFKNLPTIFEYLSALMGNDHKDTIKDDVAETNDRKKRDITDDDENNIDDEDELHHELFNNDDILSYDSAFVQRVALTPEEIVEQIHKVEHELDEYNMHCEAD